MQQLLFSPAAQNDLESIYDYTFETWGVDQAEYYVRELHKVCNYGDSLLNALNRKLAKQ